ncbi:MAG: hypothetical protein M3Q10_08725 [Chloroflexota bacterium]|nr:hypothetical protein [Chloroflexota bacterium]
MARPAAERPTGGVERQTADGKLQVVIRCRDAADVVFPVHAFREEQIAPILGGALAAEVAEERLVVPGAVPDGT